MVVSKNCKLHLETADLLMKGIKESVDELQKEAYTQPEHSRASIKRRIVQVRQELLRVYQELPQY